MLLLRATDLNLVPVSNPADAVVLAAHPGNVDTVLVNGQIVKRHGRLLADVDAVRALAIASAEHVLNGCPEAPAVRTYHQGGGDAGNARSPRR